MTNRIAGPGVSGWSLSHLPSADQQAEVELPKTPTEDGPWPETQITGLRRSLHTSLPTAAIPRFGVQTDQEEQLAKVGLPRATASVSQPVHGAQGTNTVPLSPVGT